MFPSGLESPIRMHVTCVLKSLIFLTSVDVFPSGLESPVRMHVTCVLKSLIFLTSVDVSVRIGIASTNACDMCSQVFDLPDICSCFRPDWNRQYECM